MNLFEETFNLYLHFLSFINNEMAQLVEITPADAKSQQAVSLTWDCLQIVFVLSLKLSSQT